MPDPMLSPTDFAFTEDGDLVVRVAYRPAAPPAGCSDQAGGAVPGVGAAPAPTTDDAG